MTNVTMDMIMDKLNEIDSTTFITYKFSLILLIMFNSTLFSIMLVHAFYDCKKSNKKTKIQLDENQIEKQRILDRIEKLDQIEKQRISYPNVILPISNRNNMVP